jgi:ATP-binding cassette subfamily F protein uup
MSLLLSCQGITQSFGSAPIFQDIALTISDGDRVGLVGPNGAGKSTFLQILAGIRDPDRGEVALRKGLRFEYIPQDSVFPPGHSVRQTLEQALNGLHLDSAETAGRISETFGRVGFADEQAATETLSGGWRKRLAIAVALIRKPDILLLDEPTNHLDLEGILWLEKVLVQAKFASVTISHDRYFLENVATEMAELSRLYPDGIFKVSGHYTEFLERKAEFLHVQSKLQESVENRVRTEIEWLRRGAKARTSKSKARIDAAGRMITELGELNTRNQTGVKTAGIDFVASDRRSKKLVTLEGAGISLGGRRLIDGLDLVLGPGTRLGLAGPNGSGKTTLMRLIGGQLQPDTGTIERADGLRIVLFDQNREQLDPTITLRKALVPDGDSVIYRDRPVHVAAWAKRFLFRSDQLEMPVSRLSGGEKARVLIAKLMLETADLLLLDEPTNDLDIPTLEVLEESLVEFPGALVLVTHDRYMLDRVSTTIIGLDGRGNVGRFADYAQWEQTLTAKRPAKQEKEAPKPRGDAPKKRLSFNENREFSLMEARIAEREATLEQMQAHMNDADVVSDPKRLQSAYDAMMETQKTIDQLYERWSELEAKQAG